MHDPPRIDDVRDFYRGVRDLYPPSDRWHHATHLWLQKVVPSQIAIHHNSDDSRRSILNLGSAGKSFGLPEDEMLHVDLDPDPFDSDQKLLIADAQSLPDLGARFSCCICVGSVINHCDAGAVIHGISKALAPNGLLLLEFESSRSFEFLGTKHFGRAATVVRTSYLQRSMNLWMYAPDYIKGLLAAVGIHAIAEHRKHILSALIYRLVPSSGFAARFHRFDRAVAGSKWLSRCSHNVIFVCRRSC